MFTSADEGMHWACEAYILENLRTQAWPVAVLRAPEVRGQKPHRSSTYTFSLKF